MKGFNVFLTLHKDNTLSLQSIELPNGMVITVSDPSKDFSAIQEFNGYPFTLFYNYTPRYKCELIQTSITEEGIPQLHYLCLDTIE
jgi:hypothetical protein